MTEEPQARIEQLQSQVELLLRKIDELERERTQVVAPSIRFYRLCLAEARWAYRGQGKELAWRHVSGLDLTDREEIIRMAINALRQPGIVAVRILPVDKDGREVVYEEPSHADR